MIISYVFDCVQYISKSYLLSNHSDKCETTKLTVIILVMYIRSYVSYIYIYINNFRYKNFLLVMCIYLVNDEK